MRYLEFTSLSLLIMSGIQKNNLITQLSSQRAATVLQQSCYFRNTDRLLEGTQNTYQLAWDYFLPQNECLSTCNYRRKLINSYCCKQVNPV